MTLSFPLEYAAVKKAVRELKFRTRAFIDGEFRDAASGESYVSINPATGKPLAEIAACGTPEVDAAVKAARRAFEKGTWSRCPAAERKRILLKFADLVEENLAELALLDCLDAGKPITDCMTMDVPDSVHCFRWHAEAIDKEYERLSPVGPDNVAMIVREPLGVVAAILPWNFPIQMAAWKLGPILATGNSVVVKPASQTSLSALRLAELFAEAGIPEGVVNVVPGSGRTVGAALGKHTDVDAAAFTGSTEVGRQILGYSAESNLKRVVLELGGKNPQVVLESAGDLDHIAAQAVSCVFWNMGENCSSGSRLIVHRKLKEALLTRILDIAREWIVGDPLDPATKIGPMIEEAHMNKVLQYIESGKQDGASLILGGSRILRETGGYFVAATIFDNVRPEMQIAREEIFGPVLSVLTCDTEQEAVALANDTTYGLTASLYTQNLGTAHRVARALRAGTVSVNCFSEGDVTTPFGGFKQSGFFGRDKSIFAHYQYTELKTIWMQLDAP
ncbi:MAG TPA: aldehyde dehydrogenase [Sedimentisphaerales bacterium]|nr:aldehyde dehydrogenase [Sedimentisphaerales bacterium]